LTGLGLSSFTLLVPDGGATGAATGVGGAGGSTGFGGSTLSCKGVTFGGSTFDTVGVNAFLKI